MKYSIPQCDEWYLDEFKKELESQKCYQLNNRARYILLHYFGLGNKKPKTLAELGKEFSITKERVRQIKEKTLRVFYRKTSGSYFWRYFAIRFLDERRKELKTK